jgi:Na+-driven multidrug efflux pump
MENAIVYFQLSAVSYPFLAVYNAGAALFRSMGNSKVSTLVSFLMNVVNIGGNAVLIYGFHWGVAGAATASLVSRAMAAVIMLVLICHKNNPIHIEKVWKPELHFDMIRRILKIGVPNGVENGMFQIGKLIVQGLVATFGTSAIAANAIANTIASFINTPGTAIQLGLTTVVGQCAGGITSKRFITPASFCGLPMA